GRGRARALGVGGGRGPGVGGEVDDRPTRVERLAYQRRRGAVGGRAEDDVAGRDDLVLADEHEVGEEPGEVGPAGVDALPGVLPRAERDDLRVRVPRRSEEHTSELQSRENLVCRLLLEKKKN